MKKKLCWICSRTEKETAKYPASPVPHKYLPADPEAKLPEDAHIASHALLYEDLYICHICYILLQGSAAMMIHNSVVEMPEFDLEWVGDSPKLDAWGGK